MKRDLIVRQIDMEVYIFFAGQCGYDVDMVSRDCLETYMGKYLVY